jgi:hypothetical protein
VAAYIVWSLLVYVCCTVQNQTVLTNVTLASSNSALPDDGDYPATCWSCFNVNFNTPFKKLMQQLV